MYHNPALLCLKSFKQLMDGFNGVPEMSLNFTLICWSFSFVTGLRSCTSTPTPDCMTTRLARASVPFMQLLDRNPRMYYLEIRSAKDRWRMSFSTLRTVRSHRKGQYTNVISVWMEPILHTLDGIRNRKHIEIPSHVWYSSGTLNLQRWRPTYQLMNVQACMRIKSWKVQWANMEQYKRWMGSK